MAEIGMTELQPGQYESYDYLFKICLCGNSVGKTATLSRFTEGGFSPTYNETVGVNFAFKSVQVYGEHVVKLQIWDMAGQERYRSIITPYFRSALGVVIFFDLTQRDSFEEVSNWISLIRNSVSNDIAIVLAATKSDLVEERVVSPQEIEGLAKENDLDFIEISAKTGDNVSKMFEMLVEKIFADIIWK